MLGFVNDDEEVVLHKVDCQYAMKLKSAYGSRLVATEWGGNSSKFMATLSIDGIDRMGMLEDIIAVVSRKQGINIRSLNINTHNEVFSSQMTVWVDSADTVEKLCDSLLHIKGVKFAKRIS